METQEKRRETTMWCDTVRFREQYWGQAIIIFSHFFPLKIHNKDAKNVHVQTHRGDTKKTFHATPIKIVLTDDNVGISPRHTKTRIFIQSCIYQRPPCWNPPCWNPPGCCWNPPPKPPPPCWNPPPVPWLDPTAVSLLESTAVSLL